LTHVSKATTFSNFSYIDKSENRYELNQVKFYIVNMYTDL